MKNSNSGKVDSALAYTAGVQAAPYGYDSDTNWFFVRGFSGTSTGAFLDGLPNYAFGFSVFFVDPFLLERVEVAKGPASALYGAANPGGIINMVSKRPTADRSGTDDPELDEHGNIWISTDRNGLLSSHDAWRMTARVERTDGHGVFEEGQPSQVRHPILTISSPRPRSEFTCRIRSAGTTTGRSPGTCALIRQKPKSALIAVRVPLVRIAMTRK